MMQSSTLAKSLVPTSGMQPEWVVAISSMAPRRAEVERVLVMTADQERGEFLGSLLEQERCVARVVAAHQAIDVAAEDACNLILLDLGGNPSGAIAVCRGLRRNEFTRHITVLLVAAFDTDEQTIADGLLAGADDCVLGERRPIELRARIRVHLRNRCYRDALRRLRSERDLFRREAGIDPLTQLDNRRTIRRLIADKITAGTPFAVLFVDLDRFKSINDRFGHKTGDDVLRATANCLRQEAMGSDLCARYGGEEFVVLVDADSVREASRAGERYRAAIEQISVAEMPFGGRITASVGVAFCDPAEPDASPEHILERADAALYLAKRSGRNCAAIAEGALTRLIARQRSR